MPFGLCCPAGDVAWQAPCSWGIWFGFFAIKESFGGAKLVLNNLMDRPISYVYVNGNMGPNAFAFDGLNAGGKVLALTIYRVKQSLLSGC
ncbi:hypothetical protein ACPFUF_003108 [Vibrio cholerae]